MFLSPDNSGPQPQKTVSTNALHAGADTLGLRPPVQALGAGGSVASPFLLSVMYLCMFQAVCGLLGSVWADLRC